MSELKARFVNRTRRMADLDRRYEVVASFSRLTHRKRRATLLVRLLDTMRKVGLELNDLRHKLEVAGELDEEVRDLWKQALDKEFEQHARYGW